MAYNKEDKLLSKDGRYLFRTSCDGCDIDRGYKRKSESNLLCLKCACKNNKTEHMLTPEVRDKSTLSKIKDKYINVDINNRIKYKTTYKYKTKCLVCSKDKGYCYLLSTNKPCRECYIASVKKADKPIRDKIKSNMRSNLYHRLRRRNISKKEKTFKLLNYTPEELKQHLEAQFQPGMTWDNYGEWHIDHIKPDSWFNYLSTEDESFKQSWAITNLQPLWAKENIAKSNKY